MNKLLGYLEVKVGEDTIPVKIGCYTLEKFCESFGIALAEIGSVFEQRQLDDRLIDVPKEPIKFLSTILYHGANYCSKLQGKGVEYSLEQAYDWVDEIGLSSDQAVKVMTVFIGAIMNGGTPAKGPEEGEKKSKPLTWQKLREQAIANLEITLMEYYDKTLYELTIEMQGYNSRWEEKWRHTRLLYTLQYNLNVDKHKQKRPHELIPFPSETLQIKWHEEIKAIRDKAIFQQAVEGQKNGGSGANSKV